MTKQGQVQAFLPGQRRRSLLVGIIGVVVALFSALFVVAAIADILAGRVDWIGPALGGVLMLAVAGWGVWMARWGFRLVDVDFERARTMRRTLLRLLDDRAPIHREFNEATGLLLDKRYHDAIAAFQAYAERFPERRGDSYGSIGAAHFFLGAYEEAIGWYRAAITHGADAQKMQENIAEAEAKLP